MTEIQFRIKSPQRTCNKSYSRYQSYKTHLSLDFNNRCGYTDCDDKWFGGKNTFHIDHFSPIKRTPELKTCYSNLVYSCSYVNILKSHDDSKNYIDPCDEDYNSHFYRDSYGTIYARSNSERAKYMHKKLKLGLARYSTIWLLNNIYDLIKDLKEHINTLQPGTQEEQNAHRAKSLLADEFVKYFDYLSSNS